MEASKRLLAAACFVFCQRAAWGQPCAREVVFKSGVPYVAPVMAETNVCLDQRDRPIEVRFKSKQTGDQWLRFGAEALREEGYFLEEEDLIGIDSAGHLTGKRRWFKSEFPNVVLDTHRLMKSLLAFRETRKNAGLHVPVVPDPARRPTARPAARTVAPPPTQPPRPRESKSEKSPLDSPLDVP